MVERQQEYRCEFCGQYYSRTCQRFFRGKSCCKQCFVRDGVDRCFVCGLENPNYTRFYTNGHKGTLRCTHDQTHELISERGIEDMDRDVHRYKCVRCHIHYYREEPRELEGISYCSQCFETVSPKSEQDIKKDKNKPRWDLFPLDAAEKIVEVYGAGIKKRNYPANSWREGMEWGRVFAGIERHLKAWQSGKDIDDGKEGTGCLHLACAAWGCLTLIWYYIHGKGDDDRWKEGEK